MRVPVSTPGAICSILLGAWALASQPSLAQGQPLATQILIEAAAASDELIEIRRQVHMYPELSGEEERTAALVADKLEELGLEVETGVGGYGVVGVLRGGRPGPVVAYRADMDAVPSPVPDTTPYRSRVEGVKHVCGHDAHVAVGIGIARVLAAVRDDLPGTVKFIFQPAEESAQGAKAMIRDGVLENPRPEAIFAVHATPLPVGTVGCLPGVGLSGVDPFEIRVRGAGDLDEVARRIADEIQALSTVAPLAGREGFTALLDDIAREDGPYARFVYVFGLGVEEGEGGERVVSGAVRASHADTYDRMRERVRDLAGSAVTDGMSVDVEFAEERQPNMHSDPELVYGAITPLEAIVGENGIIMVKASIPFFGEDFAYFQKHVRGALFFLGTANREKGIDSFNHFPDYDLDESSLELGTAAMANVLMEYLHQ